jgi:UDP-N-acetylglucosamine 2-epimerase
MIQAIDTIADQVNIVFPLHPRTKKMMGLNNIYFKNPSVKIIEPVGYATMIALVKEAMFCMTDSGGLQEESATLKTPTIVLRNETEYQHYIDAGFLFLTGIDPGKILRKAKDLLRTESTRPDRFISEVGNGSSLKIINKLKSILL